MEKTIIEVPTELLEAAKLTAEDAKTELAIRLYQLHKLNEAQARELAGDPKVIEALAWNNRETGHIDINDFLSWASHDLKSPLNTIIGFTRVVIKGIDGPINDTQSGDLTTAFNSSQRMLFLINNLVEMARLNVGEVNIQLRECDMKVLIADAAERWQTANPTKQFATEIYIGNPKFMADTMHLRQIISNLLNYAALRLTEGSLSLSARDDDKGVQITIMSKGKKSTDRFELDSAMLNFVAAALVKLHGGKMDEPQETADGMSFHFSLPREFPAK